MMFHLWTQESVLSNRSQSPLSQGLSAAGQGSQTENVFLLPSIVCGGKTLGLLAAREAATLLILQLGTLSPLEGENKNQDVGVLQ